MQPLRKQGARPTAQQYIRRLTAHSEVEGLRSERLLTPPACATHGRPRRRCRGATQSPPPPPRPRRASGRGARMPPLAPASLGLGKGHGTNMKSKKSQPPPSLGAARDARTHASRAGAGCEGDLRLPHAREARRGHLARAWHARKLAGEARSTSNKGRSAAQSWRHAPRGQRPPGVRAARRGAASRTSVALLSRRSVAGAGSSAARAPPLAKWLPWIRHFQNSGASN